MVAPEEAASFTAGLVVTPAFIDGLTLTLDYFGINLELGIDNIPAATALQKCLATGIAAFCDLINRHPTNESLWLTGGYISAQTTNLSEENVEGVDIIFDYDFDTPVGPVELQGVSHVRVDIGPDRTARARRRLSAQGTGVRLAARIPNRHSAATTRRPCTRPTMCAFLLLCGISEVPTIWVQTKSISVRRLIGPDGGVERDRELHLYRRHQQPARYGSPGQFRRGHGSRQRRHVPRVLRCAGPLCVRQSGGQLLRKGFLNKILLMSPRLIAVFAGYDVDAALEVRAVVNRDPGRDDLPLDGAA